MPPLGCEFSLPNLGESDPPLGCEFSPPNIGESDPHLGNLTRATSEL